MPGIRSIASAILADALALQACPCFSEPERAFYNSPNGSFPENCQNG